MQRKREGLCVCLQLLFAAIMTNYPARLSLSLSFDLIRIANPIFFNYIQIVYKAKEER